MHAHVDEDLLKPVLEPGLDVRTFRAPWNPWGILWVAFFGGALAAGVLYALNERRIGRPRRVPGILIAAVLLTLAWAGAVFFFARDPHVELKQSDANRLFTFASQVVALVFSFFVARGQKQRVEMWQAMGKPLARLVWIGILACVLNTALSLAVVYWVRS